MSESDPSRFDELMSRYLDASLDGAGEHELLECLADEGLAARFHEMTRLDAEIAGLMAGSIPDEVMVELVLGDLAEGEVPVTPVAPVARRATVPVPVVVRRKPKKRVGTLLALAAAVVGVAGIAAFSLFRAPMTPPTVAGSASAKAAAVHGEVYFIGAAGRVTLGNDQRLEGDGTIKTVGADSRATLALADGSEVALLGSTTFRVELSAGKRGLYLEEGTLRSTVAKQPANAPLVFGTTDALATVRGTELTVVKEGVGTYVIVTRGAVAVSRPAGGPEVLINAGFYGHIEPTGTFRPWPIARLPKAVQEQALSPH